MSDKIPQELDWVTTRSKCSLYEMFIILRNEVKDDVKKRNESRRSGEQVVFEVGAESSKGFSVFRAGALKSPSCTDFQFSETGISVSDGDRVLLTATITLNEEGRCKFVVNGKELENWQLRRLALEQFFFKL